MTLSIGLVTLVVRRYDEAIAFFVDRLGFTLMRDDALEPGKRWVVVAPPGGEGPGLLLAPAADDPQAAAIGSDDIRVHIGDNSLNPEKKVFLEELAARSTNVVVTCYPEHTGADENWQYLLRAQTADYFCMAADDDCYTAGYFRSALDLIRNDSGCSAAAGLYISIANVRRAYAVRPAGSRPARPHQRLQRREHHVLRRLEADGDRRLLPLHRGESAAVSIQ